MAVFTPINDSEAYFQVVTYSGTSSSTAVTLPGSTNMQPDMLFIKSRSNAEHPCFYDDIRGTGKRLLASEANAENDEGSNGVSAFNSDGFTTGENGASGQNTYTYVAYAWKESATAGFDINIHTGTGSSADVSHNLSAVPDVIFTKRRNDTQQWFIYTKVLGAQKALFLDTNSAESSQPTAYDALPTSSVINYGNDNAVNGSSDTYVAYLWKSIQGFSKISEYKGNGNVDGPFIPLSFSPAFIMVKNTDGTDNWFVKTRKIQVNPNNYYFKPDESAAEVTSNTVTAIDFLSNGFKIRATDSICNSSGSEYFFMAFAESPLVNSEGVPTTAK